MPTFWSRKEARIKMICVGAEKYRVRDNCVEFYGIQKNGIARSWYLAGYCAWT